MMHNIFKLQLCSDALRKFEVENVHLEADLATISSKLLQKIRTFKSETIVTKLLKDYDNGEAHKLMEV